MQHDGGEFLLSILDAIHEELNRVMHQVEAPQIQQGIDGA